MLSLRKPTEYVSDLLELRLTSREYCGQSLRITGPEALNYAEMTAKIGAATGKVLRFEPISEDEESQKMMQNGDAPEVIAAHLSIYRAIREGRLAAVTHTVERVLGRKPFTFDQWVEENASVFTDPVNVS